MDLWGRARSNLESGEGIKGVVPKRANRYSPSRQSREWRPKNPNEERSINAIVCILFSIFF